MSGSPFHAISQVSAQRVLEYGFVNRWPISSKRSHQRNATKQVNKRHAVPIRSQDGTMVCVNVVENIKATPRFFNRRYKFSPPIDYTKYALSSLRSACPRKKQSYLVYIYEENSGANHDASSTLGEVDNYTNIRRPRRNVAEGTATGLVLQHRLCEWQLLGFSVKDRQYIIINTTPCCSKNHQTQALSTCTPDCFELG